MKDAISNIKAPDAIGPYSQAIRANGFVYVSGQIPVNKENGLMKEDIREQTRQSLKNIEYILSSVGLHMDSVVKTTVFLSDMNNFNAMNEVYGTFFHNPYPARACFEVSKLPKNALVEIEAVAAE